MSSKLLDELIKKIEKNMTTDNIWGSIDKYIDKINYTIAEIKRFNFIIIPIIEYTNIFKLNDNDAIYNFNKEKILDYIQFDNPEQIKILNKLKYSIDVRIDDRKNKSIIELINNTTDIEFKYYNDERKESTVTTTFSEFQNKNIILLFSLLYSLLKTDEFFKIPENDQQIFLDSNKLAFQKKIIFIIKELTGSDSIIQKFNSTFKKNISKNDKDNKITITVTANNKNDISNFLTILNSTPFISKNLYSDNLKKLNEILNKEFKNGIFNFENNNEFIKEKSKVLSTLRNIEVITTSTKNSIFESENIIQIITTNINNRFENFKNNIQYKIDLYESYKTNQNKKFRIIEGKSIVEDINSTITNNVNDTIKLINDKTSIKKKIEETYKTIKKTKITNSTVMTKFEQLRDYYLKIDFDIINNIAFIKQIVNFIKDNPTLKKIIDISKINNYYKKFLTKLDKKTIDLLSKITSTVRGNLLSYKNIKSNSFNDLFKIRTESLLNIPIDLKSNTSNLFKTTSNLENSNNRLSNSFNLIHDNKLIMIPFKRKSGLGYNYGLINLSKLFLLGKLSEKIFSSNDLILDINRDNIRTKIYDRAVIIINNDIDSANIPLKWKALKLDNLIKEFKSDNKKLVRKIIIQLIDNQGFYNIHTENWENSNSRRTLQTSCTNLTSNYSSCPLLIGRDQISL